MRVLSIELADFRNIISGSVSFGPAVNIIRGANGQGKTNLVEAVSFLSWLKSFRTSKTADLIRTGPGSGCTSAVIAGAVDSSTGSHEIRAEIGRGFRRVLLDGSPVCSARETMQVLSVSCLSPDDPGVLEGGPEGRRILADRFAALLDPSRTFVFSSYARLVRERNAILRQETRDPDLLEAVEQNLAVTGAEYAACRLEAVNRVAARLPDMLAGMTGTDLCVRVGYASRWLAADLCGGSCGRDSGFAEQAARALKAALTSRRAADTVLGYTSVGPHVDDIEVGLMGLKARGHASRGQKKVLMLAWKAAEAAETASVRGEAPVLVLDDALADLDGDRQSGVTGFLRRYGGQCFITGALVDPGAFMAGSGSETCLIEASGGRFTQA